MDTLKQRLREHYEDNQDDFDPEETKNVLDILEKYDDNLSGIDSLDITFLQRMINDDSALYEELEKINNDLPPSVSDPFA